MTEWDRGMEEFHDSFLLGTELTSRIATDSRIVDSFVRNGAMIQDVENTPADVFNLSFLVADKSEKHE